MIYVESICDGILRALFRIAVYWPLGAMYFENDKGRYVVSSLSLAISHKSTPHWMKNVFTKSQSAIRSLCVAVL